MGLSSKTSLMLAALISLTSGETTKRDLAGPLSTSPSLHPLPPIESLHLGAFGPVSGLPNHPAFLHLGLSPQQIAGFMAVLLQNGLLSPNALRLGTGQPFLDHPLGPYTGNFYRPSLQIDPYFLHLYFNYGKFLPYGLGPQGFYGSTGLPKYKPPGAVKFHESKNSR